MIETFTIVVETTVDTRTLTCVGWSIDGARPGWAVFELEDNREMHIPVAALIAVTVPHIPPQE